MKNAQGIFYLIGTTIVLIVVNTIFFLFQTSKNERNHSEAIRTYEIIQTATSLLGNLKDAEIGYRGYLLTGDTSYLVPYRKSEQQIDVGYIKLYSLLNDSPKQQRNLSRLNELINLKKAEIKQALASHGSFLNKKTQDEIKSDWSKIAMEQIRDILHVITSIEKENLHRSNQTIEKLTRNIQIFTVVSNWILLIIVISALINILQNRDKIDRLFKEVEGKNEILESQKDELQKLSEDLIKQNAELERFAYVASHDLRSPGVNLISLLQLHEDATDEAERAYLIKIMKEVADNLIVKLDDLINLLRSKHEANAIHERLNFREIFSKVERNLTADIKKTNARVNFDFSEAPEINYPKSYLESIMQNLLSNALKYKHPKRLPDISIRSFYKKDKVFLEVKDNGIGIDLQKHGHSIFGIYQTFHTNKDSKGVGLYITKAQVVAMGGNIDLVSKLDVGTTFLVRLT